MKDVVIIGAGIVGCSAAYFLSRMGIRNILVIDQGPLFETGGSTSHAPGLVYQGNPSKTMCHLAQWSVETYKSLEFEGQPCFYSVGSLEVSYTPERHEDLKLKWGRALSWGLQAQLLTPKEAYGLFPLLDPTKILGALHIPSDGIAKAVRACSAMARDAKALGVEFQGHCKVEGFKIEKGRVHGVMTNQGTIACEKVLLCAGIWGPVVGKLANVPVPLTPVIHQYIHTTAFQELKNETQEARLPILRHQDRGMYFRQHHDHLGIGSYYHEPQLFDPKQLAQGPSAAMRPFTSEDFEKAFVSACELIPSLQKVDLAERFNGIFSFTPDAAPLVGESLKVAGFWVAEAVWVTQGAGVGRAVAQMMIGQPPALDLRELDCNRFWEHALSLEYINIRGAQQYREVYDVIHPLQQMESPRPLRVSPFYSAMKDLGAVFFESAGWERAQWFQSNDRLSVDSAWPAREGWTARYWSPIIGKEHKATRENVALFDLSPFTKLEIKGPDALSFLQNLSTNQIDLAVGKVIYTSMLNEAGGIECDLTITRWAEDRFWVVTGGSVGKHDKAWMLKNLPSHFRVEVNDITSTYCSLGVWGPKARSLVQALSVDDFSHKKFPYFSAQTVNLGSIPCFALRLSYVGELGWEVYTPSEYGHALWNLLWDKGQEFGIIAAGSGCFDSLRLEKGYRLWGADIHSEYTPYEAGLGFAVRLNKGEFIGKTALEKKSEPSRKLCCLVTEDPKVALMGKEPVLNSDNQVVGYVTSTNYGYTVQQSVLYCYLPKEHSEVGSKLKVLFFGKEYSVCVAQEPLFDPSHLRLRS